MEERHRENCLGLLSELSVPLPDRSIPSRLIRRVASLSTSQIFCPSHNFIVPPSESPSERLGTLKTRTLNLRLDSSPRASRPTVGFSLHSTVVIPTFRLRIPLVHFPSSLQLGYIRCRIVAWENNKRSPPLSLSSLCLSYLSSSASLSLRRRPLSASKAHSRLLKTLSLRKGLGLTAMAKRARKKGTTKDPVIVAQACVSNPHILSRTLNNFPEVHHAGGFFHQR